MTSVANIKPFISVINCNLSYYKMAVVLYKSIHSNKNHWAVVLEYESVSILAMRVCRISIVHWSRSEVGGMGQH